MNPMRQELLERMRHGPQPMQANDVAVHWWREDVRLFACLGEGVAVPASGFRALPANKQCPHCRSILADLESRR